MIPVLGQNKKEIPNTAKETLADKLLKDDFNDFAIDIKNPRTGDIVHYPVWKFIERYLRITDKAGKYVPFEMNIAQIEFYKKMCYRLRAGKPLFFNILKARQLGFSTFIAGFNVVTTLLVPNRTAIIVADESSHARTIFKKYAFMYHNLPQWIKDAIPLIKNNAFEVAVDYGQGQQSTIKIVTASDSSGRADTAQSLHLSEMAFWKVNIEDVLTSLIQVVDTTDPYSLIIIETTANGYNYYKELYDFDCSGKSAYEPLFFPWFTNPKYKRSYWGFELTEWEKKIVDTCKLDLDQIAWYRAKFEELRGNLDKLRQEYPSTPIEAFITSGHSLFSLELIQKRKDELFGKSYPSYEFQWDEKIVSTDGELTILKNKHLVPKESGLITIFKDRADNHPYIVSVDPSMGGEDNFVAQVFDNHTFEQVAKLQINRCTDYKWIGFQIYCLADYYNSALLNAECNNSTGTYILQIAMGCGHRFIYQDNSIETLSTRFEDKLGYKKKTTNTEYMQNLLADAFRDKYTFINDYQTLCEMENFQIIKKTPTSTTEKAVATNGAHDDLINALMGVMLTRVSMIQTTLLLDGQTSEKKKYINPELYVKEQPKKKGVYIEWL